MNYKKVIKDLKQRNDKLEEQYRLRDIRCIHLEYENEMLKGDFEAQHELTKKYAKENQELKEELEKEYNKGYERGILDTVEENQRLDKENRELKEQVDYLRRSIERKEETIIELEDERVPYTNEYVEKLKKQLEEYDRKLFFTKNELDMRQKSIDNKLNQQKEFIKYLEEEINKWHYNYDSYNFEYEMAEPPAEELLENALSRFKEIIGGK